MPHHTLRMLRGQEKVAEELRGAIGVLYINAHGAQMKKSMSKYEIIIYWSTDDQAFIAEVPELSGCAADGVTHQEALANVESVIQEWIETAKELGCSIPKPKCRLAFA